jgi:multiple sugar transport system substrate-binding protein
MTGPHLRSTPWAIRFTIYPALLSSLLLPLSGCGGDGKDRPIRILWAEWRPADILAEMGRAYQAETGVAVQVVRKSWDGAFGDAVFAEFRNRDDNYDIIIGDSQWLGLGAVGGHYLELTGWMRENVDIAAIDTSALKWYSEYPKGTERWYAVPCLADAMAWAYRKDLFEDPGHREAFAGYLKEKGAADFPLAPPKTWEQLRLIALYFKERVPGMAGLVMPTSRKYDQATMSFEQVMWAFGGDFGDYETNRVTVNSPQTVKALEFFTSLMEATSQGGRNMGYSEVASEYVAGRAAMACNFFAFFPLFVSPGDNPDFHDKTGFFNSPAHVDAQGVERRAASLGGQGMSINAHISPERQARAKDFLKWFSSAKSQEAWAAKGGYTSRKAILAGADFRKATAYNGLFEEAFRDMRDFWAVPEFDEMMKAVQREFCAVFQDGADPAAAAAQVQAEHEAILRKRDRIR